MRQIGITLGIALSFVSKNPRSRLKGTLLAPRCEWQDRCRVLKAEAGLMYVCGQATPLSGRPIDHRHSNPKHLPRQQAEA